MKNMIKAALITVSPFVLTACNSSSGSSTTTTAAPVMQMVATPNNVAPSVAGVTATQIQTAANGGLDATGQSGPFPLTISGGDGFQANPVEDASFATLINSVRSASGAAPVTYNAQLNTAAQSHSNDMLAQGYFSHTGANGSTIGQRATAAGYNWTAIGENIAQGQANENLAMNGWISSPGHQANNVGTQFKEFGLGRAGSGAATRWTLVLGSQ